MNDMFMNEPRLNSFAASRMLWKKQETEATKDRYLSR